jgi:hypothetical protein
MFKVVVGRKHKQETFTVYNDLIIAHSEFFRAARSKCWIEGDPTKPTILEHEDPKTFAAYPDAAYFDRIHIEGLGLEDDGDDGVFENNAALGEALASQLSEMPTGDWMHLLKSDVRFQHLIKLYILSNMLLDDKTTNMVVNEMMRTCDLVKWTPDASAVKLLYRSTIAGDGMRNLFCDYYVTAGLVKHQPFLKDDYPADFLKDLAANFMRIKENGKIKQQKKSYPAYYCANWDPSQGQHRYHTGPGTEGDQPAESTDEEPADSAESPEKGYRNKRRRLE